MTSVFTLGHLMYDTECVISLYFSFLIVKWGES